MEGKNTKGWQQRDYHREATLWLRLRYPDDEGWGERERGLTGSKRTQCSWSKMADKKELLRSHLETHKVLKNLMGDLNNTGVKKALNIWVYNILQENTYSINVYYDRKISAIKYNSKSW